MSNEKQELIEGLCSVMHDAYEAAAAKAGWETQERSRKPWEEVPEANKVTMRAAVSAALDALTFMGWVSPAEVADREAAARREALLEVRNSMAFIRTPPNNLAGLSRAQAFHVGAGEVAVLLDNALAEPERDKEGGND